MRIKRALVCAPTMPEFDRESGSRRIFHFLEFLRDSGWSVSFIAQDATGGERYARKLRQRGVAVYAGDQSRLVGDEYLVDVDRLISAGRFDVAILAFWYIAERYLPAIRALSPNTQVVVDSVDLHFLRNARRILRKPAGDRPAGALDPSCASEMIRELNTYAAADMVLAVSQKEADLINDLVGDPQKAHVVPDGDDLAPSTVPLAERKGILFIGNFKHPPNIEAAEYLCKDILPKLDPAVLAQHPVYVVGNAANETVRSYASGINYVRLVGWVPSVLSYLHRTRVSVIPLLHGAGTKRKLVQALMVETPSVSTSVGIEGLNLRDGEHVLVADDPDAFANAIAILLRDAELWQRLAVQGRACITAAHERETVRKLFLSLISGQALQTSNEKGQGVGET